MLLKHSYYLKHHDIGSLIRVDFCNGKAQNLKLMREDISPSDFLNYTQLFIASLKELNGAKRKELEDGFYISHTARKVKLNQASQATGLWRKLYKAYFNNEYIISNRDAAKLSSLKQEVTEERLKLFFEKWKVRTIGNFCKNDTQNSITLLCSDAPQKVFPQTPSYAYYEKLNQEERLACNTFWKSMGYEPEYKVAGTGRSYIVWEKVK